MRADLAARKMIVVRVQPSTTRNWKRSAWQILQSDSLAGFQGVSRVGYPP